MSIVDDVQKIAKTAIIEEKLDNLNKVGTGGAIDQVIAGTRSAVTKAYDQAVTGDDNNFGTQPGIVTDVLVNGAASTTSGATSGATGSLNAINTISTSANDSVLGQLLAANQNINSNTSTSATKTADDTIKGGTGFQAGGGGGVNSQDDTLKSDLQTQTDNLVANGASDAEAAKVMRPIQQSSGISASGVETASSIYNNTYGNITPSNPGNTSGIGEEGSTKIRAITGTDPISGKTLVLYMDSSSNSGNFIPTLKDAGVLWTDANLAPLDPSYSAGYYWYLSNGTSSVVAQGFDGLVSKRSGKDNTTCYSYDVLTISSISPSAGDNLIFGEAGHKVGDSISDVGGTQITYDPLGVGSPQTYGQKVCAGSSGDAAVVCAITSAPRIISWPLTYTSVRNFANGIFQSFPLDLYSQSLYPINTSFANIISAGIQYRVSGAINGGFILNKASPSSTDLFLVFRSDGSFVGPQQQNTLPFYKIGG